MRTLPGWKATMWALAVCASGSAVAKDACLKYDPEVVQLVGVTSRRTFPGPPNYESVKSGDVPETYWFLKLRRAVCVQADPKDAGSPAEPEVSSLQIVIDDYDKVRSLLGRKVRVTGTLFHAINGHHHTSVLIVASRMQREP